MKRKYAHIYKDEISIDGEDFEKKKVLFKLASFMFIDVSVPSKWN